MMREKKTLRYLLLVLAAAAVLLLAGCAKKVTLTIVDTNAKTEVEAKVGQTIADVLKEAEITLGDQDFTEPAVEEKITEETTEIRISRYAQLKVEDFGSEQTIDTCKGTTIADALAQAGITIGEKDLLEPAADTVISEDSATVRISRYAKVLVSDLGEEKQVDAVKGMQLGEALQAAGITVGDKDEISAAMDAEITEDETTVAIKRYAKIKIVRFDGETEVEMVGGTVAGALEKAGIVLEDNEEIDAEMDAFLTDGMTLTVAREVTVTLTVDGNTTEIPTKVMKVADFLTAQNVKLGADDEVSEDAEAFLKDGMEIIVSRVEYKEETATETIGYSSQSEYSDSMSQGTSEVRQSGVNGEKEITYRIKIVDGEEAGREVISEKVTKEPVDEIVVYGTYEEPAAGGSDERTEVSRIPYYDCDGSGHGYYEIHYSDGSVEYEVF